MCSYKLVDASFEVWGLQTRAEEYIHRSVRDVLLLGHRQAFAWIDEWYNMTLADVRAYEAKIHQKINEKMNNDKKEKGSGINLDAENEDPGNPHLDLETNQCKSIALDGKEDNCNGTGLEIEKVLQNCDNK